MKCKSILYLVFLAIDENRNHLSAASVYLNYFPYEKPFVSPQQYFPLQSLIACIK